MPLSPPPPLMPMFSMKNNISSPPGKPKSPSSQTLILVSGIFFFVFGLTIGMIFCINHKTLFFNVQINDDVVRGQFFLETAQPTPPTSPGNRSEPPPSLNESGTDLLPSSTGSQSETLTSSTGSGSEPPPPPTGCRCESPPVKHKAPPAVIRSDLELLWRASVAAESEESKNPEKPKLAFMFLTKERVILAPFWEKFFKGNEGLYSIYVHGDPDYNGTDPEDSVFHGTRIRSKKVEWGKISMVEAERRLLASALLDYSNQRFILLSDSCIPLRNFSTIYNYIMNTALNFVEVYDDPSYVGRGRYSYEMSPTITLDQWRKGSQWFTIDRHLAGQMISDEEYFPLFSRHCTGDCYADEHYLPTMVYMNFAASSANRTLTWVDWSIGGPHPTAYPVNIISPDFLRGIQMAGTPCLYNGEEIRETCVLFARKFNESSLTVLLNLAPGIMHFNP